MELSEHYVWELETCDGEVHRRGGSKKWQDVPAGTVLRASLVPALPGLQRVDVFCHAEDQFVGWFGKGFIRQDHGFQLAEYAQCIETEQRRVWALSGGRVLVTHPDFQLRV